MDADTKERVGSGQAAGVPAEDPAQLEQLRAQVASFRRLSRGVPVPKGLVLASAVRSLQADIFYGLDYFLSKFFWQL